MWASIVSTLRPHPLRKSEHEQQQIMIGFGRHGGFRHPWDCAVGVVYGRANHLHAGLLPGSHRQ
ncbi:hypothetical protein EDF87_12842 [Pseudomonas helmanticensis]|uniref:Uncharacterized protein n=2 Tax=Pseudomonas TaxID=286 RepID=A0A4R7UTX9_9PSED|nr:hypothetical protein EDF87_12842 [Pseudomonas helmanticensis]VVQ02259.1 hypothetical protein PS941_02699 [Pseudomonas fluorescens]